jgi:uncharacterized protein YgiM (DUF1202 family)
MKNRVLLLILLAGIATACTGPAPVVTPVMTTSDTTTATLTPSLTFTPLPPSETPTPVAIEGTLSIKVNVRNGPGTSYASLGQLDAGQKVGIIARNVDGSWYQILYSSAQAGRGWVAAPYVVIPAGTQVPLDATPTPSGPTGLVTLHLNVRSGPGTNFDTLGTLDPNQTVSLTGKNTTASWFQINYPAGPAGHGWVTAQYVQTDAASSLPVLDDYGNIVTPGAESTVSGQALSPTPTIGPAYMDGDSSSHPAVNITFTANGTHQITYSSQVSAPQGDIEDWVEFTPYTAIGTNANLLFSLTCSGNSSLLVELWQNGAPISVWGSLLCGDTNKSVMLVAKQGYLVRLTPAAGTDQHLVSYTLRIQNIP